MAIVYTGNGNEAKQKMGLSPEDRENYIGKFYTHMEELCQNQLKAYKAWKKEEPEDGQEFPLLRNKHGEFTDKIEEMMECLTEYSVAYQDDDGQFCRFSIATSTINPNYWMISIVKGPEHTPEDQVVTLLVNPDFTDAKNKQPNPILPGSGQVAVDKLLFELATALNSAEKYEEFIITNNLLRRLGAECFVNAQALQDLQNIERPDLSSLISYELPETNDDQVEEAIVQPSIQQQPRVIEDNDEEDESLFTKAKAIAAKITAVGIPAAIGAAIGSLFMPGVGTIIGGVICGGGAAALGLSGVGLYELYKKNSGRGTALTITGGAGVGAAVGAILGSLIPIPGVGTLFGMAIGAGVGLAVGMAIGAGLATFGKWLAKEPWERESANVLGVPSDDDSDYDIVKPGKTKNPFSALHNASHDVGSQSDPSFEEQRTSYSVLHKKPPVVAKKQETVPDFVSGFF
ncbi:Uncharacterised protein [Legionella beliardensis]|uniref:Uncharacterized protein n=1 Tax=Legionella beliardensis TaxID=91822 RepID=A0A378I4E5_9GAMM|nr:glycine zipper family protein [Legionella beliardensis]STX29566.1 Uncharacterised protein [Legionella beliardensis]